MVRWSNYVSDIVETAQNLNAIEFPFNEEWVGTIMFAGSPESYKPMIMAFESSNVKITGDLMMKNKLLQEVSSNDCEDVSLMSSKKPYKKKIKCNYCSQFGHIARNCKSKDSQK